MCSGLPLGSGSRESLIVLGVPHFHKGNAQVADPGQDAVQSGLVGDASTEQHPVARDLGRREAFEGPRRAATQPPPEHNLVLRAPRGLGTCPWLTSIAV